MRSYVFTFHKSTTVKLYPFFESDKVFLNLWEDMVGGPSIVITRKAVEDEIFNHESTNWSKTIVGLGRSQLYLYFMCQAMLISLYKKWELVFESQVFFAPEQD